MSVKYRNSPNMIVYGGTPERIDLPWSGGQVRQRAAAGEPDFDPSQLTDPRLWRLPSAETVQLDGNERIEVYQNRLAAAHHATQSDDTRRPSLVDDGGVLAVEYTQDVDWLVTLDDPSLRLVPRMHMWWAVRSSTTGTTLIAAKWEGGVTPRQWALWQAWGNGGPVRFLAYDQGNNVNTVDGPVITDGARHVVHVWHTGTHIGIQVDGGTAFTEELTAPPADIDSAVPIGVPRRYDVDSHIPQALHYEELMHVVPADEQAAAAEIAALWSYFGRLL